MIRIKILDIRQGYKKVIGIGRGRQREGKGKRRACSRERDTREFFIFREAKGRGEGVFKN